MSLTLYLVLCLYRPCAIKSISFQPGKSDVKVVNLNCTALIRPVPPRGPVSCFYYWPLVGVVGLAKQLSPAIKNGVEVISAPLSVIGIAIALLVLLPETLAALRAARRNQLQTSLNLAFGSALATIGLTIPAVGMVAIARHHP